MVMVASTEIPKQMNACNGKQCCMLMKISKCSKFQTARVSVRGRDGKVHQLIMFYFEHC